MSDECDLCLLGLIFLSSLLTGSNGVDDAHVFISSGGKVHLPCDKNCPHYKSNTWIYNRFSHSSAVQLINLGKKNKDIERHERLNLWSDCSLSIKNITNEDSGLYTCQQYVNGKQYRTDARVFLHVLQVSSSSSSSSQTEIRADSVTLSCQLYSYYTGNSCEEFSRSERIDLFWVNQAGVKLKRSDSRYQIVLSSDHCIISLTTTLLNEDLNRDWRCAVTHRDQVKASVTITVKRSAPDSTQIPVSSSPSEKRSSRTTAAPTRGISGVDDAHVFISSGEDVRLSCNNALTDCTSTTWNYNRFSYSGTVELIGLGKKKKDTESHERLSLGSDCSLNIRNITKLDCGLYSCQQWTGPKGQQKQQGTDACVFLHVLQVSSSSSSSSQTEISTDSVTLFCQLYSYPRVSCEDWIHSERVDLFWVNQAGVKLKRSDSRDQILLSSDHCIISLKTTLLNEDLNRDWRCNVTLRDQVKTSATYTVKSSAPDSTQIPVSSSPSEKRSSRTTAAPTRDPAETENCTTAGLLFRVIVSIVKIAVFAVPTVFLLQIICVRRAGEFSASQSAAIFKTAKP